MVSSSVHAFLGIGGWAIIPDLVTRQLLKVIHNLCATRLSIIPPQPGTPSYRKHYAYTFGIVVLGYLLYNMVQSLRSMPPNYYELMGVYSAVDENGLKIAFRQFAKRNHPDRPEVGPEGEALFMMVRDAFEALKDPVKRFAYDRFGPDALGWTDCVTPREYLMRGLMQSSGYHIVVGCSLLFYSAIGRPSPVSFWRFMLFIITFALELALIVSPSPVYTISPTGEAIALTHGSTLNSLFPQRVPFQHVLFLHQLSVFLAFALSRVAPQFFTDDATIPPGVHEGIHELSSVVDREASIMVHAQLQSIHPQPNTKKDPASRVGLARIRALEAPSPPIMKALFQEMEELIIETNIKKDGGPLRSAWENALRKFYRTGSSKKQKKERNFWEAAASDEESEEEEGVANGGQGAPSVLGPLPDMGLRDLGHPALKQEQPVKRPAYVRARSLSI